MRRTKRIATAVVLNVAVAALGASAHAQGQAVDAGVPSARRQITKVPRLAKLVEAEYPPSKRESGIEAVVVLTIEVSANGDVTRVYVAESAAPDFDSAAMAAAKQLIFEPAEVDGKPTPAKIAFRYVFASRPAIPEPPSVPSAKEPLAVPPSTRPLTSTTPTPNDPEKIEVRARPRERHEVVQTTIGADQARKVAGSQGDPLKVVQNFPGVSRPPAASGQLVVWGSAPRDTRIYVDGVDIPALYHGSGLRSVIPSDLVASVNLVPGAFGAEYGRGLGGIVRVESRSLPHGTHGFVAVDTLDGSTMVSTELGARTRIAISGRVSWLDRVLELVSAPDVSDYFPIPRYRDAQVKATVDLRRGEAIDFVVLGSTDTLTRTVTSADPASARSDSTFNGFWRAYARYTKVGDESTAIVTPFFGRDTSKLAQRFGGTPTRLDVDAVRYGLRATLRSRVSSRLAFTVGVDALGTSSDTVREGSLTLPPREGDIAVFGQPPTDDYTRDAFKANIVDLGPNAHADLRLGPVTLTPGVRMDAFLIEGSRKTPRVGLSPSIGFTRLETALAPRLSGRWELSPRVGFMASYGQYSQTPEPEELSAVFGTPDLALSRASHLTAGQSVRLTPSLTAEVVGFHKSMKDLVVRSRLPNPVLARALTQNGEGRSYGVQVLVRQELWRGFFGWVSYAISRSERRNEGDLSWRAFDFDQPHVLSIVSSQDIGQWTFGARFRYATGNPRTPVVDSSYDARSDRYDPVFGRQNTIRIPEFWQLDLRVERNFALGSFARLVVFADIQNVTNRSNAEDVVYSASFRDQKAIPSLPTIAVLGARVER